MPRLALLTLLIAACNTKPPADAIGAVYYESWVFVGADDQNQPIVVSLNNKKSQTNKQKVEREAKLLISKEEKTRVIFVDKSSQDGALSQVPFADKISLLEEPCGGKTCLRTTLQGDFSLTIQSEPLTDLIAHDQNGSRIGDAITRATLSLNKKEVTGCLFVERGFAPKTPPNPFFGDFDWFALLDEAGGCWLLSGGTRVSAFVLNNKGEHGDDLQREALVTFADKKSGQTIGSSWSLSAPVLGLSATLQATSGHRGAGEVISPKKRVFYGSGSVEGTLKVSGEERGVVGWVQHITDQ